MLAQKITVKGLDGHGVIVIPSSSPEFPHFVPAILKGKSNLDPPQLQPVLGRDSEQHRQGDSGVHAVNDWI
jgi:hypothetical protein